MEQGKERLPDEEHDEQQAKPAEEDKHCFEVARDRGNREWLLSAEGRRTMPESMLTFYPPDREVDPAANFALFSGLGGMGDVVRVVGDHSPISIGGDSSLMPDIIQFFFRGGGSFSRQEDFFVGPLGMGRFRERFPWAPPPS